MLLPPTNLGRQQNTKRSSVANLLQHFIQFAPIGTSADDLKKLSNGENICIIAIGSNKKAVSQFVVILDGIVFASNINNVSDAIAYVFCCFFVFNIEYNSNLTPLFIFIQHYLFEIKKASIANNIKKVASRFNF